MIHEGFAQNSEGRESCLGKQSSGVEWRKATFLRSKPRKKEQADMTHVITCSPQPFIYARILNSNKFFFFSSFPVEQFRRNQHILIINTQTLNLLYFARHCNLSIAGSDHDFLMRPKLSLKTFPFDEVVWTQRRLSGSPAMASLFRVIDYTQRIWLASVCLIRRIQFIQWYEWYRRRNKFTNFPSRKRKCFIC